MIGHAARVIAFAIAAAAMLDPSVSIQRPRPLAVEVVTSSTDEAARVRDELLGKLEEDVAVARPGRGDAVVAIGRDVDIDSLRDGIPLSFVRLNDAPNVRLVRANVDGETFPGQGGAITVEAEVLNMDRQRSKFTATQNGVEIGAGERIWTSARQQQVIVPFVALGSGSHRIRVVSEVLPEEGRRDDNAIDVNVTTSDRRLTVAFIEPRPSWAAKFVRQAIDSDLMLQVSSLTRASLGVDIRVGSPPSSLTSSAVDGFELLAIGAPEELRAAEVERLRTFMADRGGTVLLLPDRLPSGPFTKLIPAAGFDEMLFATPVTLNVVGRATGPRASEFAVPSAPASSMETVAALPDARAVVAAWPVGTGTLIVSGALDAWRYRPSGDEEFAAFWRALAVGAVRRAPSALSVQLNPAVARPGTAVRVTARVRRTQFEREPHSLRLPPISAVAVSQAPGNTTSDFIRLWPASEPGVFQGDFTPSEPRPYTVHVSTATADATAMWLPGDPIPEGADEREAAILSAATGGVVTTAEHLAPVVDLLRSRRRGALPASVHPMRSAWWILPFTIVLCAEWTIRRRRGER